MEIEVYPSSTTASQEEFKELLKSEFSKNKNVEEGKVIECTVKKITSSLEQELQVAILKKAVIFEKEFKIAILWVSEILTVFGYSHHHFAKIFAYF